MSIQIPFSRDNLSLYREGPLSDLFNPTKHNLWVPTTQTPISAQTFRNILAAIFTRQNVSNTSEFLIPLLYPAYRTRNPLDEPFLQFTTSIIQNIPDQHLWMLPFIFFSAARSTEIDIRVLSWTDYSSPTAFAFGWDERRQRFSHNTTGAITPISFIADFCERFSSFWNNNATKYLTDELMTWYPALTILYRMLRGFSYTTNNTRLPNSDRPTANDINTQLLSNPESTLTLSYTNGNTLVVNVNVPITYANRSLLYQVFQYTHDVTTLLHGPRKLKTEGTPVYVGVELELTTDYTINELIDATKEPFFIAKQDSSISGSKPNRMELVTAPGSFKYLKQQYALWFNNLDYQKFDCTTNTSNGMHVHVDRKAFDDDYHIRNFCWFINNPANTPFIVAISDRGSLQAMQHYTPFLQFPHNTTRTKAFKQCHRLIEHHRGATNLKGGWNNAKTVEVRIFKGIVSYAAIVKNLEFVESVFHFTQSLRSYREMSLSTYIDWLFKTPTNRFSVLKKFIENQDIEKFLIAADIKDIIFNETDPEKIAQILLKSGITLTNAHVSFLNKGRKRTFTLDKDSGVLNVLKTNIFKLANLDIDLAKRITRMNNAA